MLKTLVCFNHVDQWFDVIVLLNWLEVSSNYKKEFLKHLPEQTNIWVRNLKDKTGKRKINVDDDRKKIDVVI